MISACLLALFTFGAAGPAGAEEIAAEPPVPKTIQRPASRPGPLNSRRLSQRPVVTPQTDTSLQGVANAALAAPAAPPVVAPQQFPVTPAIAPAPVSTGDPNALKWDSETKSYTTKTGETSAHFTFWLTNVSPSDVFINGVHTSCGCTVAKLPSQPWKIEPGTNGPIEVTVNTVGKSGLISKGVTVDTSVGLKYLTVQVNITGPAPGLAAAPNPVLNSGSMPDGDRLKNMQLALADRQIVFKNQECAKCHAEPAHGKTDGRLIYAAVCAVCHNSHLRAAVVPDLRTLNHPTDADHWRRWINYGRAGSMMPAFSEAEGGPLNARQVDALVEFMLKAFPSRPLAPVATPAPAAQAKPATQSAGASPVSRAQ